MRTWTPSKTCQRVRYKAYENSGTPASVKLPGGPVVWGMPGDFYKVKIKLFSLAPLLPRKRCGTGWAFWDFGGRVCYTGDYCSDPFIRTSPVLRRQCCRTRLCHKLPCHLGHRFQLGPQSLESMSTCVPNLHV